MKAKVSLGFPWDVLDAETTFPELSAQLASGNHVNVKYDADNSGGPGFIVLSVGCRVWGPGDLQEAIDWAEDRIRALAAGELSAARNKLAHAEAFARSVGV